MRFDEVGRPIGYQTDDELDQPIAGIADNVRFANYDGRYVNVKHVGAWTVRDFCAGVLRYRQQMHKRRLYRNQDHQYYEGCTIDRKVVTIYFGS